MLRMGKQKLSFASQVEERTRMNKQQNSPLAKTKPSSTGPESLIPQASLEPPGPLSQTPPMQRPVEPQEGPHKVSLSRFLSQTQEATRICTHKPLPKNLRPQNLWAEMPMLTAVPMFPSLSHLWALGTLDG